MGSKAGYMLFQELVPEIRKVGLESFNRELRGIGYDGKELTSQLPPSNFIRLAT